MALKLCYPKNKSEDTQEIACSLEAQPSQGTKKGEVEQIR